MFDDPGIALIEVAQAGKKRNIPLLKNGKRTPLSEKEVKQYRDSTIAMLIELWKAIDYGVTLSTQDGAECTVWRSTTAEETGRVADGLLTLGTKSAAVAMIVRGAVKTEKVYGAGSVLAANAWLTALHYAEHGLVVVGKA